MNWFKTSQRSWGKAGAGILFVCNEDKTALLVLRSKAVEDPEQWGVPGGAVGKDRFYNMDEEERPNFSDQNFWQAAIKEVQEELGYFPTSYQIVDQIDFQSGGFVYRTFIVAVPSEEKEKMTRKHHLNWENTKAQWYPLSEISSIPQLHRGVQHVMESFGS